MHAHHREVGLLHQALQGAPNVHVRAARAGRHVSAAHGVQARPLHQDDCICPHGLIEFSNLRRR